MAPWLIAPFFFVKRVSFAKAVGILAAQESGAAAGVAAGPVGILTTQISGAFRHPLHLFVSVEAS